MNAKGYTIVHIMMVTAMVLILSSVGIVSYQKVVQMGKESTCEANLKVLNGAVEAYVVENYAIPAVLGDLERNHFEKAYAKVMNERNWLERFTQLVARSKLTREAHAQFLTWENLKGYARSKDVFTCPSDENGGTSYGINDNIKGRLWPQIGDNVIIVGDCDSPTFDSVGDLRARHGTGDLALAMTKGEALVKVEGNAVASVASGDSPTVTPDAPTNTDYDVAAAAGMSQALIDTVSGLGLSSVVQSDLLARLDNVKPYVEAGNTTQAIQELQLFANEVQQDMSDGNINASDGNDLLDMANDLTGFIYN